MNGRSNNKHDGDASAGGMPGEPNRIVADNHRREQSASPDSFADLLLAATPQAKPGFREALLARMLSSMPLIEEDPSVASATASAPPRAATPGHAWTGGTEPPVMTERAKRRWPGAESSRPVRVGRFGRLGPFSSRLVGAGLLALLALGVVVLLKARQGPNEGSGGIHVAAVPTVAGPCWTAIDPLSADLAGQAAQLG